MTTLQAVILAVIEGLTEYLPVSSTGHMILGAGFMGINEQPFTKDFAVVVQFGAILAVLVLYWRRFLSGLKIYRNLFVAFLPAAVLGLLVKSHIDRILGSVWVVSISLLVGGIVLLWVDQWLASGKREEDLDRLTPKQAVLIGLFQCLAFIPGVSRAAATMIGAGTQGLSRKAAAEFSFLLAVPTLTGATLIKTLKFYKTIQPEQISLILLGNVIAFIVALVTVKGFIGYLQRSGLRAFGWYRIVAGLAMIALLLSGVPLTDV